MPFEVMYLAFHNVVISAVTHDDQLCRKPLKILKIFYLFSPFDLVLSQNRLLLLLFVFCNFFLFITVVYIVYDIKFF